MKKRCSWAGDSDPVYIEYHDTEWAVPVHDDEKLFEFMVLESAQAGLSWRTILNKREGYRKAFKNFDPKKVARMTPKDVERLMGDASIIRNRLKIGGTITNAQLFLEIQKEFGSFDAYVWEFVNGKPIQNNWKRMEEVPAVTPLAITMAKDLKKRGFKFLGPTIWYAYMQAVGIVNDHTIDCYRRNQIKKLRSLQ